MQAATYLVDFVFSAQLELPVQEETQPIQCVLLAKHHLVLMVVLAVSLWLPIAPRDRLSERT
jgi:hypothetical protein